MDQDLISKIRNQSYDVIISGAGPAGISAAYHLSQSGHKVLVLDKARFPREKICGDGLTPPAICMLEKMGVLGAIENAHPHKSYSLIISSPNSNIVKIKTPSVKGFHDFNYTLPRIKLDKILIDFIKEKTDVQVLEGFKVTDLLYDGHHIIGVRGIFNNREEEISSQFIIGADGPHSPIARKLSLKNNKPRYMAFAVRAYFENVSGLGQSLEFHYEKTVLPGYGWIFPLSEKTANIGLGLFNRFKSSKDIKKLFEIYIEKNIYVYDKVKNASMVPESLKGFPLPCGSYPGKRSFENVLLTGDAASFVDPLTGEGIYYALVSGQISAQAINGTAGTDEKKAGELYERLWRNKFHGTDFLPGYILQSVLNKEVFLNFIVGRAIKKERTAGVLAGVINHVYPKKKLFFNII